MLELVGLCGGWGDTVINEDVSLTVEPGESVALIGRNGVGKTTLLELIVGRARRRSGHLRFEGADLTSLSIQRRALSGVGYVPQSREVFRSLTVQEHLDVAQRPGRWTSQALYAMFPSLAARKRNLALHLSGGEQQMLAIARALAGNPRILLMDEPSEGLAPVVVEGLVKTMRSLLAGGSTSMLVVEQTAELAAQLSDRCLVMDRGRIVQEFLSRDHLNGAVDLSAVMGLAEV